ncbi:unnamed protein product, partial [Laminaria digitata]
AAAAGVVAAATTPSVHREGKRARGGGCKANIEGGGDSGNISGNSGNSNGNSGNTNGKSDNSATPPSPASAQPDTAQPAALQAGVAQAGAAQAVAGEARERLAAAAAPPAHAQGNGTSWGGVTRRAISAAAVAGGVSVGVRLPRLHRIGVE